MNSIIAFLRRRPKTEARRSCGTLRMRARDERTVCEVERVRSRGGTGTNRQSVERSQTVRWSRRTSTAIVSAAQRQSNPAPQIVQEAEELHVRECSKQLSL
jgi:hypothetical protein